MGYHNGTGRSKHGYYKGIYSGSTYELCWIIYNLDHNIEFKRFPGCIQRDKLKYFPDFLLPDNKTIIEIKGYEEKEKVRRKTELAESFGYTVKILYKEDLKYAFDYVAKTYNTKKFFLLYDDYKPKYSYTCTYCNSVYERDFAIKTNERFCSRICAGKYRNLNSKPIKKEMYEKISSSLKKYYETHGKGKENYTPYKRKSKRCWIFKDNENKIINELKLNEYLNSGWIKGRLVKKLLSP